MNIIRTYFNKDTVLVRDSLANTGRNPIAEIFHGGSTNQEDLKYSRYIFNVDLTDLIQRTNNNELFVDGLTHKINITNTSCFDLQAYCRTASAACGDVKRATSFDLILFEVPEEWDEGNGYDYVETRSVDCDLGDIAFSESASNWPDRMFGVSWSQSGVYTIPSAWYSGSSSGYTGTTVNLIKGTQHFDRGDENLCIDITSYVNGYISSGITELNLGVAFEYAEEITPEFDVLYTGFFGMETQTVYEPFLESSFDDTIIDDRDTFYLDKDNRLYLYVNAGGERTDAVISGVTIYDHNDVIYQTIPNSGITQVTTGVYYVTLNISSDPTSGYCGDIQFRDVWTDVTINGNNLGDIDLDFIIKDKGGYYNIGSTNSAGATGLGVSDANNMSIYDYEFSFNGIKRREKVKRGDTRRVNVTARVPFTTDQSEAVDKIYYRIFIKEGETQIEYIDWNEVSRTPDGNFFFMDTSWFIPNDYFLEIKIESGNEIRSYHDIIQFEIVSEKDWC